MYVCMSVCMCVCMYVLRCVGVCVCKYVKKVRLRLKIEGQPEQNGHRQQKRVLQKRKKHKRK